MDAVKGSEKPPWPLVEHGLLLRAVGRDAMDCFRQRRPSRGGQSSELITNLAFA